MTYSKFYQRKLFVFLLLALVVGGVSVVGAAYPDSSEVVLFHLESGSGTVVNSGTGSTTYDSAMSGNAVYYATTTTPFGSYAANFDDAGDYIDTKFGSGVDPTANPMSVSLWVNKTTACNSNTGDDHIFGYGATGVNTRFYIRCPNSTQTWAYRLGGAAAVSVGSAIGLNRWYHLALVVTGSGSNNVVFYVNGVSQGTTTVSSYSIGGSLYVGSINATSDQGANATIDEVAIYNKALTGTEVATIYTAGRSALFSATTATATEGGSTGSYTLALKTAPTADVTVTPSPDADVSVSPSTLTFTSANWFTPQTVTVTAVNDDEVEGTHTGTITHSLSSSDTNYNGLSISNVTTTITDNDTDSSAPTITNVSSDKTNGFYGAGEVIDIDVTFSEAVTSTGSVTVTLETGTTDRTCTFTVSNSTTGTCDYTVQAGDTSSDLTVNTISGTIADQSANAMSNFTPATNLAANKAIAVGTYISFVSPSPTSNSTTTSSSVTVYASSTIQTTATSTDWSLYVRTPGGSVVSQVSTSTRYGDYNLTHLTNVISDRDLSLTNNTSGSAYVPTTGTIFIVHNSSDVISEVSTTTGAAIRTITCSSCGDIEGITLVSSIASSTAPGVYDHTFVISLEQHTANGRVFRVVIPSTGSVTVNASDVYTTGISYSALNSGLEGIAYNPTSGVYYIAVEDSPPSLYEYPVLGGTAVQICSNLSLNSVTDDISDLAYNNNILYVLSHLSDRVVPVNITSTSTCAYVDSDGDGNTSDDTGDYLNSLPVGATNQAEAITWDNTGDYLYVFGEADFMARYRTNAYTVRHTFTGLSNGSYVLTASSTDATTALITHSPMTHVFGLDLDVTAPTITNVSSDKANGSYTTGEVIDIDVTFSEAVTSTGSVTVTLETGTTDRTCTFTVSNSTTGTCDYTVQAGDTSSDLTVNTISGTIADQSANAMSNFTPATNLAANKALVIDTTAPSVSSLSPLDNATGVSATTNLVLTFDAAVTVNSGNVTIKKTSDDSTVEAIDITDAKVTGTGTNTITINPASTLASLTEYYVQVDAGAVRDAALNSYAGISSATAWSFTAADTGVPTVTSISSDKTNGAYKAGEVIDIDVTFSEAVTSTGSVTVTLETGATDRTCTFTVSNSTTGTCNYTVQTGDTSADLDATISGTIADQSSNAMSDFNPTTTLATNKALVIDTTAPTISTLSPVDNATDVSATANLVLTFDSVVTPNTGNVTIKKTSDDSTVEAIDVSGGQVSGSGSTIITLNPAVTLDALTEYYVQVASTAFRDVALNSYAGISNSTSWSFTTAETAVVAEETPPSSGSSSGGSGYASSGVNPFASVPYLSPIASLFTPAQLQALITLIQQNPGLLTPASTPPLYVFTRPIGYGARGEEVKALQRALVAQRPVVYPQGLISGYFGHLTELAVMKLQDLNNIAHYGDPGYGTVGPATRAFLNKNSH